MYPTYHDAPLNPSSPPPSPSSPFSPSSFPHFPSFQVSKSKWADDISAVELRTSHVVDEIDYRHGGSAPDALVRLLVRSKPLTKVDPKDVKYPGSSYNPNYSKYNPDADCDWGPTQEVLTRSVVMTAPVRVLMSGRVDFKPPLPDTLMDALQSRNVNKAMKIIIKFRRRCWPKGVAGTSLSVCMASASCVCIHLFALPSVCPVLRRVVCMCTYPSTYLCPAPAVRALALALALALSPGRHDHGWVR